MTYAIVNVETKEVVRFYNQANIPDPVVWPNGDAASAAYPGLDHAEYRLVSVVSSPDAPNEFHQLSGFAPALDGSTLTMVQTWQPIPLTDCQRILSQRIDDTAEANRLQYVTPGTGQAMTYQQKLMEAQTFTADAKPDPTGYPLLNATVGIEGETISDVATLVLATAAQWTKIAAAIETIRLSGKAAIRTAATVDAALAAFNAVQWP